jgi:hypothetical protein
MRRHLPHLFSVKLIPGFTFDYCRCVRRSFRRRVIPKACHSLHMATEHWKLNQQVNRVCNSQELERVQLYFSGPLSQ